MSASTSRNPESGISPRKLAGLFAAAVFAGGCLLANAPEGLSPQGWRVAGVALAMAALWITEAVPVPVTALLPMVLFPLLGISEIKTVAAGYSHPLIFLFLGGFLIALAMEKHGLHVRIALRILRVTGGGRRGLVAGMLVASAAVSMWVSNTATALMMYPIAVSLIESFGEEDRHRGEFQIAVLLAVAYGSSIGGIATLIGTPPNALMAGFLADTYGIRIGFGQWMTFAVPLTLLSLPAVYWILTRVGAKVPDGAAPGAADFLRGRNASLGRPGRAEITVAAVFCCTVVLWICQPFLAKPMPFLSDTWIAMAGGLVLFFLPGDAPGTAVMDWKTARALPWDVLILFGGGLALASGIESTGLAKFLGGVASHFGAAGIFPLAAILTIIVLFLTELTSNTATAATFLPVAGALAAGAGHNPLLLVIPIGIAASCAFMLPVATPPNAVVFAGGRVPLPRMAFAGLWLNLLFAALILAAVFLLGPVIFETGPIDALPAR